MPKGNPTATVYIWYPHTTEEYNSELGDYGGYEEVGNIGHASMYIGDPYKRNYVSWWPKGSAKLTRKTAEPKASLFWDEDAEGCAPHVTYTLYGLSEANMKKKWNETLNKYGDGDKNNKSAPTYHYMRKNCSGIVARILKAGGANKKLSLFTRAWFTRRVVWTPKRVAMVCNELRDNGYAIKVKAEHCPAKESIIDGFIGLR